MAKAFEESIDITLQQIKSILLAKRKVYGKGNILKFGLLGIVMRVSDKFERLYNFYYLRPKNVDDSLLVEAIEDTWLDMAGYAILALLLLKGEFDLPD